MVLTAGDPAHRETTSVVVDARLVVAVVGAAAATLLFVVSGRAEFVAAAAPLGVLALMGLAPGRPPSISVAVTAPARVTEGDRWDLVVAIGTDGPAEIVTCVAGVSGHGTEGQSRVHGVVDDPGSGMRVAVAQRADAWGRHVVGPVDVVARRPGGWLARQYRIDPDVAVRVLPARGRLNTLLHPDRPGISAGAHLARTKGGGTDFADLRPYRPGDRLRDLSWSATARAGSPWVVEHHPDRSGVVVVVLDGFTEGAPQGALDRAARLVWSLARHHLDHGDRVGLMVAAPTLQWLPPVAGHRARLQVVDALLDARPGMTSPSPRLGGARRWQAPPIPADAVVIGVSALESDAFVAEMARHRRSGHRVVVLGIDTADLLVPADDDRERAARRLWAIQVDNRRRQLRHAGISTVGHADAASAAVRAAARRSARRPTVVNQ